MSNLNQSLIKELIKKLCDCIPEYKGSDVNCHIHQVLPFLLDALDKQSKKHRFIAKMRMEDLISTYSGSDPSDNLMEEEMQTYDRLLEDPDIEEMMEAEEELD